MPEPCWPSCQASSCLRPARLPPLHRLPHSRASTAGLRPPGIDRCGTSPLPCSVQLLSHSDELRLSPVRGLVRLQSLTLPVHLKHGNGQLSRFYSPRQSPLLI